jgi:hypothetical protein
MGTQTAVLVTAVKSRVGEDTTPPGHGTHPMIVGWLNEAQRKLCAAGSILMTVWQAKSVAGGEFYQLSSDYFRIVKVEVRRADKSVIKRLYYRPIQHRPIDRSYDTNSIPAYYYLWGANDPTSKNNKRLITFDVPFGTNAPSDIADIFIYARQKPKDMAEGGQDPEVEDIFQDGCVSYAVARWRERMAATDPAQIALYRDAMNEYREFLEMAKRWIHPLQKDQMMATGDDMGYTDMRDYD